MMCKRLFLYITTFFLMSVLGFSDINDGLMLNYEFSTDEGVNVTDQSGNDHHGTVYGAVYTTEGVSGGAYYFDGINDHIIGGNLGYIGTGTISFWMKPEVVENWRNPFSGDYASWDDCIRFEESTVGEFAIGALGMGAGVYTDSLQAGQWYHVVYAWDDVNGYAYLNGQLVFTNPHPDPNSSVHPNIPNTAGYWKEQSLHFNNVVIGNGYSTQAERHWKGWVDEVRIYNRVLDSGEIAVLSQTTTSPLVVHYDFDSDEGALVLDKSGNGNHATIIGSPSVVGGASSGAFDFAKYDYVQASSNPLDRLGHVGGVIPCSSVRRPLGTCSSTALPRPGPGRAGSRSLCSQERAQ